MKISITRNKLGKILKMTGVAAFWIFVWELLYLKVGHDVLVVSPFTVASKLFEMSTSAVFWTNTGFSIMRIIIGFLLGLSSGIILAVVVSAIPFLRDFVTPFVTVINSTPVASFILLALVWLKTDVIPVFATFLVVVPMVFSNVSEGISKTSTKLLEMSKIFKFGFFKEIRLIYIPSVLPYFISAFTASFGMAWKAGVAAEVLSIPKYSIGSRLRDAKIYLETGDLFAWTVVVILLSMLIERLLRRIIKFAGGEKNENFEP